MTEQSPMRVHIVMGGDFPEAVFKNYPPATKLCDEMRKKFPNIIWRIYTFDLREDQ